MSSLYERSNKLRWIHEFCISGAIIKNDGEFALFELFELVGLPEPTERANSFSLAEDAKRIMKEITDYLYFLEHNYLHYFVNL